VTTPPPARGTAAEQLSRAEARRRFREHVTTEPDRIDRFVAQVAALGGPPPACGRDELARLGAWLIDALEEAEPSGPAPDWAVDWRTYPGAPGRLSTETLWLIDGAAAWFARCYHELVPDLEWELDTYKSSVTYHRPVLGTISPPAPASGVVGAALKDPPDRDWLGRIWDAYAAAAERRAAAPPDAPGDELLDEVTVSPADDSDWDVTIWIPEAAESILGEAVFEQLADRIAALPGVVKLVWEDREVMLALVEPGVLPDALRARVVGALDEARRSRRRKRRPATGPGTKG
jgi:hypothetical protein